MSDEPSVVVLRCGRVALAVGSEAGISATEVTTAGDQTVLDLGDLRGTIQHLGVSDEELLVPEAVFIVDLRADDPHDEGHGDVAVDTYGEGHAPAVLRLRDLASATQKGILAEAAFAARRQRLADAADSLDPLTSSDAARIGRFDVPGSPLLNELRAERRRALWSPSPAAADVGYGRVAAAVRDVVADLRASVYFGLTGFLETADDQLEEAVRSACDQGGWGDRLRFLIAAEETLAIDLLLSVGQQLERRNADENSATVFERFLFDFGEQREGTEKLASLLEDAVGRLPAVPQNPARRLIRRKALGEADLLHSVAEAYVAVVTPLQDVTSAATWDEAAQEITAWDNVTTALVEGPDEEPGFAPPSINDAARLFGQLFEEQLPAAKALVDDITRAHPGADVEEKIQAIKRQSIRKLSAQSLTEDSSQAIQREVALLTMAIALLRGIEPRSEREFQELGGLILANAAKIADRQARLEAAFPLVAARLEMLLRRGQVHAAEYVFHELSRLKPSRPGAARDMFKSLRSQVWRARYDKAVAEAAFSGVSGLLQNVISAGAPRLIVRSVDRSLRVTKR